MATRIKHVITRLSDTLSFGKHKGKSISSILTEEASYILWLDEKEIVDFSQEIIDLAFHNASEQQEAWRAENYNGYGEDDDWGDRD